MRSDSEIDGRFLGGYGEPLVVKCDTGIQTDNDPITDEAPEFAARPPPCKKKEMIPCMSIFEDVDQRALEVRESSFITPRYFSSFIYTPSSYVALVFTPFPLHVTPITVALPLTSSMSPPVTLS